jgi:hypothetical protein
VGLVAVLQVRDSGFQYRIERANKFETELFQRLQEMGFGVARNGTEHTHPDFVNLLRQSSDQTSLAIRFQPDGVACIGRIPRSFYVEAKAGKNIEKTAWEQYQKLVNAGNIVVVVFGDLERRWQFADGLGLINGNATVEAFPSNKRFPVIDGWITPRGSGRWEQLRPGIVGASGTPYRQVDVTSLFEWGIFKSAIIRRLERE